MSNGGNHEGVITIGDLDPWIFDAHQGEIVTLNMQEITGSNFSPSLQIYGPNGLLITSHTHSSLAQISIKVPDGGIFVVVASSGIVGGTGTYQFTAVGLPEQNKQLRFSRQTTPESDAITINWPSSLTGSVLQQNSVLAPTGWEDVVELPIDYGMNMRMSLPIGEENRFFRLRPIGN